ncbi:AI-2E family transporter [Shewanella sp. NFH-SH190041]|uniref:AI-2E family transporter n=1 Tax=Shewanella sp. NFH-SH190041 TaxID=2950245 RepID=UPI0021C4B7FE|nr:AI-2E family transporter [Shewanella sp. NFH-SH190041]BDM64908.1 AI-2E family transporter [Shewanella sp. NFH-SH190041]
MPTPFKAEPRHWILILALCVAAYACYLLIAPYLGSIVLGFIVSLLFLPVHSRINHAMPRSPNLASFLSCTLLTVIVLIPLLVVAIAIVDQGITFFSSSYHWLTDGGAKELLNHPWVQTGFHFVNKWLPFDTIKPEEFIQKAATMATNISTELVGASTKILGDITGVLVDFSLMLFVLFFFLRDNDKLIDALRHVVPLSRSQEDQIFTEVEQVAKSAVLGSFLTAIAQGIAGGVAMALAGFPGLFWGSIMAFASFIPFVGTALIWLPAALYLALTGDWNWAIFLVAWGVLVVGSIDNFLRPLLMQGDSGMNTLMLFFSLLGGLQLFGLIGLIYGPIIFAVTLVLFRLYEAEFKDFLQQQDNQ